MWQKVSHVPKTNIALLHTTCPTPPLTNLIQGRFIPAYSPSAPSSHASTDAARGRRRRARSSYPHGHRASSASHIWSPCAAGSGRGASCSRLLVDCTLASYPYIQCHCHIPPSICNRIRPQQKNARKRGKKGRECREGKEGMRERTPLVRTQTPIRLLGRRAGL